MIIQDLWKSSNADMTGADVSVTYNTVTVVYAAEDTTESDTKTDAKVSMYGDVKIDNTVDIMDVILANKYLVGAAKLDDKQFANADVNADGDVNSADSLLILKRAIGALKESDFPYKK
jgi:hypothetical protein